MLGERGEIGERLVVGLGVDWEIHVLSEELFELLVLSLQLLDSPVLLPDLHLVLLFDYLDLWLVILVIVN